MLKIISVFMFSLENLSEIVGLMIELQNNLFCKRNFVLPLLKFKVSLLAHERDAGNKRKGIFFQFTLKPNSKSCIKLTILS